MKHSSRAIGALLILAAGLLFAYLVYDASELARMINVRPDREAIVAILGLGMSLGIAAFGAWLLRTSPPDR